MTQKHAVKIPKLRFPGFTGEWQSTTLGEVCDSIESGGTPETTKEEYWNGDIFWATPTEVQKAGKYIKNTNRKITRDGLNNSSAKILPIGSLLLCTRATIGDISINTVPMCTNQGFKNLIVNKDNDNIFLYYLMNTKKNTLLSLSSGSTFLEINKSDIANLNITIPIDLKEQQRIASCLSSLDSLIELEQKKYALLQDYKKGLMQKLLTPQPHWESTTLGEVCEIITGKSKAKYRDKEGKKLLVDMGSIDTHGNLISHKKVQCDFDFLNKNDLVMPKDDIGGGHIIGKIAIIPEDKKYILGDHVFLLKTNKEKALSLFIKYFVNSVNVNNDIKRKVTGSAQLGLSKKSIENQKIKIPPLAEQKRIADILSSADTLLEKQQRKIDTLQHHKKGLLQGLLVGQKEI